ncbi:MAG: hypothetical protein AAFV53_00255 [Myxococcota bacterium]
MGLGNGEHPNGRAAMDDLKRRLRESGYSADRADKRAREVAIREDNKRNGRPNRPRRPSDRRD